MKLTVVCDESNNTPESIAEGFLIASLIWRPGPCDDPTNLGNLGLCPDPFD